MTWPAIPHPPDLQCALRQLSQHIDGPKNGCPVPAPGDEMGAADLNAISDWDQFKGALEHVIAEIDTHKKNWGSIPRCKQHETGKPS